MQLLVKSDLALNEFACRLREILNIPESNRTRSRAEQRRYGVNRGGEYYLIESLGLWLLLIRNQGETEIAGWPEYPYYLIVEGRPDSGVEVWAVFATYLRDVLRDAGLEAEINRWLVEAPAEATSDALAGRRG